MTNYIVTAGASAEKKKAAEAVCKRLNDRFGYRVADPDFRAANGNRPAYYTGGVVLSERGARELADLCTEPES